MSDVFVLVLLVLACVAGLLLTVVRLSGTWLILVAAIVYSWSTDWQAIGPGMLGFLAGLAVFGEIVEFLTSMVATRRGGGSRAAGWAGLIGGIAGMFVFSIPLPVIGTMIGAVIGCFAGAMLAELAQQKRIEHGARVGYFAAVGFVIGLAVKIALALVMSVIVVVQALRHEPSLPAPVVSERVWKGRQRMPLEKRSLTVAARFGSSASLRARLGLASHTRAQPRGPSESPSKMILSRPGQGVVRLYSTSSSLTTPLSSTR